MSQEFTLVKNKRSRKGPQAKKPTASNGSFAYSSNSKISLTPKFNLEDFLTTFNTTKGRIEICSYYKDMCSKCLEYLGDTVDIVCYGIGSIQSNKQSLHQFALITLLRKYLKISGELFIFDPVLTEEDVKIARHLGCTIVDLNEEGKRKVSNKTLFFMPHCTKPLYSNVLWANWGKETLSLITIIGNSFSHYNQRMIQKRSATYDYVERITEYTTEICIVGEAPMEEAFNDTNIHIFESEKLEEGKHLWKNHSEPPPFALQDDPELIGATHEL